MMLLMNLPKGFQKNTYAQLDDIGWQMSKDQTNDLSDEEKIKLEQLKQYLAKHMRVIKLPKLLVEVDNELHFLKYFMSPAQQKNPSVNDICAVMATLKAHGCNIGLYTMPHLIEGVSYH